MLGIDARAARVTWTVFLIALLLWIVYLVRESILIFVAALFVAYVLSPLVELLVTRSRGKVSRIAAIAIVFAVLFGVIGLAAVYVGSRAIEEGTHLAEQLPGLIRKHQDLSTLPVPEWLQPYRARLFDTIRGQLDAGAERILPLIQSALGGVMGVLGSLGFVILVPVLTFLFMKDAGQLRDAVVDWVPSRHRNVADEIMSDIHVLLGQYIRALVILSVATSVIYLMFFQAVGLPYAVLLSALAAPLEFIPFIGPLIGTLLILVVALVTGYEHFWWIVIFFVIYRVFQDYVLQPYLMSQGIELHPLVVMFGALAGQQLGGLWGMFLSVPVLAMLRIVLVRMRKHRIQRDLVSSPE